MSLCLAIVLFVYCKFAMKEILWILGKKNDDPLQYSLDKHSSNIASTSIAFTRGFGLISMGAV